MLLGQASQGQKAEDAGGDLGQASSKQTGKLRHLPHLRAKVFPFMVDHDTWNTMFAKFLPDNVRCAVGGSSVARVEVVDGASGRLCEAGEDLCLIFHDEPHADAAFARLALRLWDRISCFHLPRADQHKSEQRKGQKMAQPRAESSRHAQREEAPRDRGREIA